MAATNRNLPSLVDDPAHGAARGAPRARGGEGRPSNRREVFLLIGSLVAILAAAGIAFSSLRGASDPGEASRRRVVIDSQTGEVFRDFRVGDGDSYPRQNPKTGTNTLYPAEACFWNPDGTAKLEPTYVFVRAYLGEDVETKCPDCGRKVVPHNPMPPDDLMIQAAERAKQPAGG